MCCPDRDRARSTASPCLWLIALLLVVSSACIGAREANARQSTEVWLVTYGPGEIYWQRFGHNGIWIRDPGLGLDHVFNFGFFDFEQKGFLKNFLQGRLLYFSAAQPAQREFAQYIDEDRSIRAQRLDLSVQQALALTEFLVNEVQPENRDYLYHYYRNNCSTRVRDALDQALGGAIRAAFEPNAAKQNLRDHTRRLTIADYWLYLGLELALGSPVDQPISRWEEFFIPAKLAEGVAQLDELQPPGERHLVIEDVMLFQSTHKGPPLQVAAWWPRFLLPALAVLLASALLSRMIPLLGPVTLARAWLSISACLGLAILYFWFFTDHDVARNNMNIALFNPVWLLCWAGRRFYLPTAGLVAGLGVVALLLTQLPPHQYTADALAAFLPLNLAAAAVLWHSARKPGESSIIQLG